MIKEDHYLACTTRMFETPNVKHLVCANLATEVNDLDRQNYSSTYEASWPTSSRLSDYSLVKEQNDSRPFDPFTVTSILTPFSPILTGLSGVANTIVRIIPVNGPIRK